MNTWVRILIVGVLAAVVAGVIALKRSDRTNAPIPTLTAPAESRTAALAAPPSAKAVMPRLVDLGADKCIPCKLMAPILEDLKKEYASQFEVQFIDVWKNPEAGKQYGIEIIPTQIFYDARGKELFRHTGFFGKEDILAKWKELGVDTGAATAGIVREEPVRADTRPRDNVCFLCDGDIAPAQRTLVKGTSEQRNLCSPHCYFIYLSSLVGADPKAEEAKVQVTDTESGNLVPAVGATYLYGLDSKGRPTVQAFAQVASAMAAQVKTPGAVIPWDVLRSKELATRCGFCDRAVYPEDACPITVAGGTRTQGCCTHCALGVAARLQNDIEVEAHDGYSGELIRVKTLGGQVASIEPASAMAWFGQKKLPDGKWASAGCFKHGFFISQANLKAWLEQRPSMTGRQISIAQALADKMKLSPEQIAKACKLGECK
ncbi:MAG: thioredoxin fold domain-containing protein [Verrucomicrobiales bacterium]|nr:thioredoxin fold domain-containing protein [Verrucomicrobiales bacterium]